MAYKTLEKLFYMDSSASRFSENERLARERLESDSAFRTGIQLDTGELFISVPRELSLLNEQVLRKERRVSALWKNLPSVALGSFVRGLIADEVVCSNEIEQIRSTRRQVEAALDAARERGGSHAPFYEFAQLYLNLADHPKLPETLEDIRRLYDSVVEGTLSPDDEIKTTLFRREPVYVMGNHGTTVHTGVAPNLVRPMMEQLLRLMHTDDLPATYRAIVCHLLFEYIHPFFDGNGRTGRYLLALQLSEPLSQPTVLSLSRVIAEHKSTYYKAFATAEKKLNHAEATHFVMTMLELIGMAQDDLIIALENKSASLEVLEEKIPELERDGLARRECNALFYAAQMHLFGMFQETRLADAAACLGMGKQTASKALSELASMGLLVKTRSRPLTYQLSKKGEEMLFSDRAGEGAAAGRSAQ